MNGQCSYALPDKGLYLLAQGKISKKKPAADWTTEHSNKKCKSKIINKTPDN